MAFIIKCLLLVLLCTISTGCATITRGTTESYAVETKPAGADVSSSSGWTCKTPCSVEVKRRSDFVLKITKPGYEEVTASVTSSIDGAGSAGMAGNVLLGGIIGAGVDAGTGAMHSHKPNPLVVELSPLGGGAVAYSNSGQGTASTYVSASQPSVGIKSLSESERSACRELDEFDIGAGGAPDASANLSLAMNRAIQRAQESGADAYFVVNTNATASNASVTLETYLCKKVL